MNTEAHQEGLSCLDRRDYDAAIIAFTEAIRLNPKSDEAYYDRGIAYSNNGDFDEAVADFSETIRLHPTLAPAY